MHSEIIPRNAPPQLQHGASTIEFALVFPLFVLFFYGIVCFGVILLDKQTLSAIASEAARSSIAAANVNSIGGQIENAIAGHSWIAGRISPCENADSKFSINEGRLQICLQAEPIPLPTIDLFFITLPPPANELEMMLRGTASVLWEP